jgi:hypothetical protein
VTDRAERCERLLREACRERGCWVSGDGRIGEGDAAVLLGWSAPSLRNARIEGRAPPWFRLGGSGHRISYRITDLARFIEGRYIESTATAIEATGMYE